MPAGRHRLLHRRLLGRAPADIDADALNRELVLDNGVVFGTVNANRRHDHAAAAALAKADQLTCPLVCLAAAAPAVPRHPRRRGGTRPAVGTVAPPR